MEKIGQKGVDDFESKLRSEPTKKANESNMKLLLLANAVGAPAVKVEPSYNQVTKGGEGKRVPS